MSVFDAAFVNSELSKKTSIFGLHLWAVIGIVVGVVIVLILFLFSLCITASRRRSSKYKLHRPAKLFGAGEHTPVVSKEIQEIVHDAAPDHRPIVPQAVPEIQIDMGKVEHRVVFSDRGASSGESRATSGADTGSFGGSGALPEVSHLGWGRWYTLRELEAATNGLADENVIGEGGYGIVYYGMLADNTKVAIKNLLNNRGQAEKEFKVEVDAIGRVRHKNLVRLLGYCVEGAYRMLVYEYVDNGNLDQWLHGDVGEVSPLTWEIRVNIILGTAKGLAYLHEGLEPKVVHRDIKASNILLDRQWNAKLSDFGLAKLLNSESSYVTTRVMGTFGYVAPEYACTGMLNEKSDIYSFGIFIMEIITGRSPVDYSRPQGEVNLVDWLKMMVGNRKSEEVVDPKLPERPASKALKRVILVALRCVDPDALKRPKMGQIIHMLEAEDLTSHDERRVGRESSSSRQEDNQAGPKLVDKPSGEGTSDTSEGESRLFYTRLRVVFQLLHSMSRPQDPHRPFLPFGNPFRMILPKGSYLSPKLLALLNTFEETLVERLKKLKPRDREDVLSLSWMRLAIESLCGIHTDIKMLITALELPVSDWDDKWIDVYFDNSVKLLDICNAFTSEISRLNQGHLFLQCALHNLSSDSKKSVRALSSLDGWRHHISSKNPRLENCFSIMDGLVKTLDLPKIKNSAKGKVLMRAMYGVKAVTVFVCSIFATAFSGSAKKLIDLQVPDTCLWAEAFSGLQTFVNTEIRSIYSSGRVTVLKELEAVDASVKNLYPIVQNEVDPIEAEMLQNQRSVLGRSEEKLSQGLDLLSKEVDIFFKIVLTGRDALLGNLRIGGNASDSVKTDKVEGQTVK